MHFKPIHDIFKLRKRDTMFTDTHCHIYKEYYQNIDEVILKAQQNNINRLINNGCNLKSNQEVISLINTYPEMFGALGIHPESVNTYQKEDISFIEQNLHHKKVIAIGEIGLDYHYTKDNKPQQIALFKKQLKIAQDYNLPVIVHSREATLDTINILKEFKVTGVIHSFSGSYETAQTYIKMGFLLGINGVITFKNSKLKEVIKKIPLEFIVLETDSPYLTPEPYRGKPNEPAHIHDIAKFVGELKNISLPKLARITNQNIKRIFDI